MFKVYLGFVLLGLANAQPSSGEEPSWTSLPASKTGKFVSVSCHGTGPDKDVAIRVAIGACKSIATEFISGTYNIKTLSIETEETAGFHSEVAARYDVQGLNCQVDRQFEEEIDEISHAWMRCRFDSSLAKIVPLLGNRKLASTSSKNKQLIFSSIPDCTSLVIRGKMDRMLKCKANPQTLLIYPTDSEIIVRAVGRAPKHIELVHEDLEDTDTMEVYLEKR